MKLFRYILLVRVMMVFGSVNGQTNITIALQSGSDSIICDNGNTALTATVTGCNNPKYQWYKNGVAITSGGTGSTISLNAPNSVANGDVITCKQEDTASGCKVALSNGIKIIYKANQALTWINTSGNINQTICQFSAIAPIKFQVTGATNATVSGLPTGVTGSYSNGVFTISGTPTQNGSFGYQVQTSGTSLCGTTAQISSVTLNVKKDLKPELDKAGSTDKVTFNGLTYFIRCVPSNSSNISISNLTQNISNISTYKINWGDGGNDTTFNTFNSTLIHNYARGFYQLTFTTTSTDNCISSIVYGIFVGNSPQGTLGNPGNLSGCGPMTITFPITNVNNNVPGTSYYIEFGDGKDTTFIHPNIPPSITHIYNKTSCGFGIGTSNPNTFTAKMTVVNPCFPKAEPTIGPIVVSLSPEPKIVLDKTVICVNNSVQIIDSSTKGANITAGGCNTNSSRYWTITPNSGYNSINNLGNNGGNPNDIDFWSNGDEVLNVTFTQSGLYSIRLYTANSCNPNNPKFIDTTICVNPTPTASFTTTKDTLCVGDNLTFTNASNTPLCSNNVYSWSVTQTNVAGCSAASAPIFVNPTNSSSANPILNFSKPGTYVVSLTTSIQGTTCTSTPFKDTIIVKDKPNVTVSLSRPSICQGDTMTPLVVANCFTNNATYSWSFQNGTPATSSIKSPTGIVFNTAGTNNISVTVTNNCGNATQATTINVVASPTLTATPTATTICNGQTATINLSSNQAGIKYTWTSTVTSGTVTGNTNQSTPISTSTINNTINNSGTVDAVITYTIQVIGDAPSNCPGEIKTVTVTVRPGTTPPNAGLNQNLCNATSATLAGNQPTVGTGTWTKVQGGTATITSPNLYNTTVTGLQPDVYLFVWTIIGSSGGSCPNTPDTMQIINRPTITTANAGNDVIVCNFSPSNNSITLQGNAALPSRTYETGTWTILAQPTNGNGSFNNANNPSATFTFNQTGNYTLVWTITNDINCPKTSDTILVKVYEAAVGGTTSNNATVCQGLNSGTITLNGFTGNIVKWQSKVLGSSVWIDIANTTSTFSYSNLDTTTSYQAIISTTNTTDCPITASSAPTTITVNPTPSIGNLTGSSPTQCNTTNGSVSFTVSPTSGTYNVTYNQNGNPQTQNNVSPIGGVITINNLGTGVYDNIKVSLAGCSSNTLGSVTLSNPNKPATPIITAPAHICSGNNLSLSATTTSIGTPTFNWTFADLSTATGASQTINNVSVNQGGVYHVTVTINQCISNDTTFNVIVDSTPVKPTISGNTSVCIDSTLKLTASATSNLPVTYHWSGPNSYTNNISSISIASIVASNAGSYNVTATSIANTNCVSVTATTTVTVNVAPVISNVSHIDPSKCLLNDGSIKFDVSPNTGTYTINYLKDGTPQSTSIAANAGSITISNLYAGVYSNIKITLNACPSLPAASVTLSNPNKPATPVITAPTDICSGNNLTLTATTTSNNGTPTFNWVLVNGATPVGATQTINNISVNQSGDYHVKVTINQCESNDTLFHVIVDSTPVAPTTTPIKYCQNDAVPALTPSGNNYVWYNNAGLSNGSTTAPTPSTITVGSTTYYVIDSNSATGCKSSAASLVVTVNFTPIISLGTVSNPAQCQAANGSIKINGLPANTSFLVFYKKNGGSLTTVPAQLSDANGVVIISNLTAGNYSNIFVTTTSGCTSNTLPTVTLVDPNPPATPVITAPAHICSGNNLTLSATTSSSGTPTFNWVFVDGSTPSGATQTINNISVNQSGDYHVKVTINQCVSNDTLFHVTVDSTPLAPIISGNTTVCRDSTLNLLAASASSGVMTYNWTVPVGSFTNTPTVTILNVTSANAGSYSVTATSTINTSCVSAAATTTVTVNPTPIISNLLNSNPSQCATATGYITFNVMPTSGIYTVNYLKDGVAQTATITANAGVIKIDLLSAGTYSNIIVMLNACPSNIIGPITLHDPTPPATPIITGVDSICSGKTLILNAASPIPNAIYTWTHPNGTNFTGTSYTISSPTLNDNGSYKLYVTLNLCKSKDTSLFVRVDSTPIAPIVSSNSPVCTDSIINLFSSTVYPLQVKYNWTSTTGFTSASQNPTIPSATLAMGVSYNLTVTTIVGACVSNPSSTSVTVNQTPHINFKDSTNPSQCATATGNIRLSGLNPNTVYQITYTIGGNNLTQSQTTDGSGILKIDTLRAGTYSNIFVTLSACPSNKIGSYTLVDPNPPATPIIIGTDSICSGKNLILNTPTPITNATYTWTHPNGTTVTNTVYTLNNISLADTGFYKLYVILNLCKSKDTSFYVRVDSTPVASSITSNSPVCTDSTIRLFSNTVYPMQVKYHWSASSGFTSIQQNPTIPTATLGMGIQYNLIVTSIIGACVSNASNTNVTVNQTPHIVVKDSVNPNKCATPTGYIRLDSLKPNTTYQITYTVNGNTYQQTQISDVSGILKIDTLRAGIYSNISVTLNACPSNIARSVTLKDPNPPATPVIIGVDSICSGNTLILKVASPILNGIYTWTHPNNGVTITDTIYTLSNITTNDAGFYKLYVTLNLCQSKDTTLFVRVDSTPVAPSVSSNTPVCTDSTINLFATTVYPMQVKYNWSATTGFTSTLQNPILPLATLAMSTQYNLIVTSVIGACSSNSSNTNVTVNQSPDVNTMPDTTYKDAVQSGLILFTGNVAGTTYNWTNTNTNIGLTSSGIDSISFTTSNTTPYPIFGTITVTPSTLFCVGKPISFKITVNPTPKLTSPLNDTICTNTLFSYQATCATVGVKYAWSRDTISGITNAPQSSKDSLGKIDEVLVNITASPIDVIYKIKLVATDGSINTQNITVTVNPDSKAQFTFTTNKLCTPGIIDTTIIKTIDYPNANSNYQWYANNVSWGNVILFPGYTIVNNGDSVNIQLIAINKYGCKNDTVHQEFYTVKTPKASFTKDTSKGCGPLIVNFTNTTTPLNEPSYKWLFGNGDSSTLQNPLPVTFMADTSTLRRDTTYYITLIAFNNCDTIKFYDSVKVRPQPRALFQPSATVGCSVFHFNAVNNSLGVPSTFYWYWGDGNIDSTFNNAKVFHDYHTGVTDTFTLKLLNKNECGVDSFKVDIVVYPNVVFPRLIVNGQNTFACAPQTIQFINNSFGGNLYKIDFGDGSPKYVTTKGLDTVYHLYPNGGNYIASIYGTNGCSDTITYQPITIYQAPKANFSILSSQLCRNYPIQFKNLSDSTLSFEWWFGDGSTSISLHPTHSYLIAGNYTVTLIAKSKNPTGAICIDTMKMNITIHQLPVSSFTNNAATQNCQPYYFIGITKPLANEIVNWNFYDSYSVDTTMYGNVGTHTFYQVGIYNIRLITLNIFGCSDTATTTVKVNETPKVKITSTDSIICTPGKQVTFSSSIIYTATDPVNYSWYVDGVLQSTNKTFTHSFTALTNISNALVFQIKLVVSNSYGCRDSASTIVVIYPKAQPSFVINASMGCVPFSLQFNNTTHYANIYSWYLDGNLFSNLTAPNPIILSNPATTYTIKLIANHTLGCGADSVIKKFTTYTKPISNFLIPNKNSCTGILNIQCFDLSSVIDATITKWKWIFGDGTNDTLKNPTHTYTTAGHFNIGLIATDNRGCLSDISYQTVANFGKPKANFSVGNVCVKNPLIPINVSTAGLGSTAITNYLWNWGDGNYTIGNQPIYVYQNEGNYNISLIVTSDSSCITDTLNKKITVYGKPTADFTFENNCVKENTLFTNASLSGFGQASIGNSKWLFGDGVTSVNYNTTHVFNTTGDYIVELIVSGNRCPNLLDSIKKIVTVHKPRDPVIYPRIEGVRGTPIQLYALSGGIQYSWLPITGLSNAGIKNPIGNYTIANPNIINYNISITDSLGCKVTDKQEIWLFGDADIFVPTAFTPNGDGANDLLKPLYVNIARIQYFRIFDRWGKEVFETSDMGKAWDGTINGSPLPMETYSWMIGAITQQGKEIFKKGNVTLIRD